MSKTTRESIQKESSKFPDRLYIPSNIVSRIGSPENHDAETPCCEDLHFFISEGTEVETYSNRYQASTCENFKLTKAVILKELDLLKVQIQLINQKLDRNLKELEKTHEKHNQLKKPISTEIKTYKETITEEVNCSCSNQCTVF